MPNASSGQFLDTAGIELEGEGKSRGEITDLLVSRLGGVYGGNFPFTITRDASTESNVNNVRVQGGMREYLKIYTHNRLHQELISRENISQYGYEIVVNPLEMSELKKAVTLITNVLVGAGDFTTPRSAVHFHIGFAHNVRLMKKLLAVCLKIDPFLFRLGGMGRQFRGSTNLAAYARPLTNSVAVPVGRAVRTAEEIRAEQRPRFRISPDEMDSHNEDDREPVRESERVPTRFVQVINPMAALQAKSVNEFWANFGVFPAITGLNKYHPVRYTGCNFYAILMHGTMEFRHFNQSLDADLIFAIAKFLRATVEMSTMLKKQDLLDFGPEDGNQEITMESAQELLWLLDRYFHVHEVNDIPTAYEYKLLMETMEASSFIPLPETPVRTHNQEFTIPENLVGNLLPVKSPLKPANTDIHNIRYSTILGD